MTALLRREGWTVNHKRVEKLWWREGLRVPAGQPERRPLWLNDASCVRLRTTSCARSSPRSSFSRRFSTVIASTSLRLCGLPGAAAQLSGPSGQAHGTARRSRRQLAGPAHARSLGLRKSARAARRCSGRAASSRASSAACCWALLAAGPEPWPPVPPLTWAYS